MVFSFTLAPCVGPTALFNLPLRCVAGAVQSISEVSDIRCVYGFRSLRTLSIKSLGRLLETYLIGPRSRRNAASNTPASESCIRGGALRVLDACCELGKQTGSVQVLIQSRLMRLHTVHVIVSACERVIYRSCRSLSWSELQPM